MRKHQLSRTATGDAPAEARAYSDLRRAVKRSGKGAELFAFGVALVSARFDQIEPGDDEQQNDNDRPEKFHPCPPVPSGMVGNCEAGWQ